jgi:hypothetical protein
MIKNQIPYQNHLLYHRNQNDKEDKMARRKMTINQTNQFADWAYHHFQP